MIGVVDLTRTLIGFETVNPPGDEAACAQYLAGLLQAEGLTPELHAFGERRLNLICRLPGTDASLAALVLTGHLDVVPLGAAPWTHDPFAGALEGDRLYGRGASDMKSGVAAMLRAFVAAKSRGLARGITLLLTGGEEVGCQGAVHLRRSEPAALGGASAMLVGEPTANRAVRGHKGALFVRATVHGVTAHSSTPELGDNAIYRAARAVLQVEDMRWPAVNGGFLGGSTINVGLIRGGLNANSVPDRAEFTLDVRSGDGLEHGQALAALSDRLGDRVELQPFIDMPPVLTADADPFFQAVSRAASGRTADGGATFFSDASVFQPHYGCPTILLGPGEPDQAHQVDEYCHVTRLIEAEAIYGRVIDSWCG